MRKLRDEYDILFAYGDRHAPHNDPVVDNIVLDVIQDLKPDIVLDGGDFISADALSTYPKQYEEMSGLQRDLDEDYRWRTLINARVPKAEKIALKDNHFFRRLEDKKKREVWLEDLRHLQAESLLRMDELGWSLVTEYNWKDSLLFLHGDEKAMYGYSASTRNPVNKVRSMVKDTGISMVRFHSHVTGIEPHTQNGTTRYAIQLGTIMDLAAAKYIKHLRLINWTQSFGVFYLSKETDAFAFIPVILSEKKAVFNGKLYT